MRSRWKAIAAVFLSLTALAAAAAPAAGASWKTTQLPGGPGELFLLNVDCPTTGFCAAVGTQNLIATSTDPTGGPAAWHSVYAGEGRYEGINGPVISSRQVQGVSCPSAHLCVAVTTLGQIYTSTDPTGPASTWSVVELKPTGSNVHLYGVSCPTESLCVAVSGRRGNAGKVFTSTDPTGGVGAWHEADLGEQFDLRAVSCSSPTLCVAAGANGELIASTDPTGGPTAWAVVGSPGGGGILQSIDCVAGACLTGNSGGNLLAASEPTKLASWRQANGGGSVQVTGSACASASACLAVDSNGDVITSTEPTGPHPAWSLTNVRPYSEGAEVPGSTDSNGLFGASCPSLELCVVVGSRGAILTSTEPFATPAPPKPGTGGGKAGGKGKGKRGPLRPHSRIAHLEFIRTEKTDGPFTVPRRVAMLMRFYAHGPVRRFECRLDRKAFHPCRSPKRYAAIGRGIHMIRVRAVGRTGLPGPAAAERFYVGRICRGGACLSGAGPFPHQPGWKFTQK